jgi:stress-induced morphogen
MAHRPTRSLQHEYERYLEQEIENYKESVPRSVLLSIGDEAVAALAREAQFTLTELIVWEEVDRIIARRLRLPSATTWRRRRLKAIEELRRPERWGMTSEHPLVRGISESPNGAALVAGAVDESPALYLAANGCRVTAIDEEPEAVDRVMHAALRAGLTDRIDARVGGLESWSPESPLFAVIVSDAAFTGLTLEERHRVVAALQRATVDGGVHLVQALASGTGNFADLRASYEGWAVEMDRTASRPDSFLATKRTVRAS